MMRKKNLINEIGTELDNGIMFRFRDLVACFRRNNGHEIDTRRLMKLDLRESKIEGDGGG